MTVRQYAATYAGIVGAIGFAGGFFGPMILTPEANQGPMLGIFITGPIGFVLGGIIGTFQGRRKVRPPPLPPTA